MPFAELKDVRIHYELAGSENGPALMFSNSLGTSLSMWDPQMAAASKTFRLLRYDKRGHGESSSPAGLYSIETLGRDALGLLDSLKIETVYFCGLSIGGQTGMWLGLNAPERLKKLVLCNTGAKIGAVDAWNTRIETVRKIGMKAVSSAVIERWFTPRFRENEPATIAKVQRALEGQNPEGYAGCCAAVRDFDYRGQLGGIRVPTLVIAGTHDPATPASDGRIIAEKIPGAKYAELDAAHLSNIEQPERFTTELTQFLGE